MRSISSQTIDSSEISALIGACNTGIEFEYAICLHLLPVHLRQYFDVTVVENHKKRNLIRSAYERLEIKHLTSALEGINFVVTDILIATQDDEVGPSDLVLLSANGRQLGLSVKYDNSCSFNVSGNHFLSERSVSMLKNKLDDACRDYIKEMTIKYGDARSWFRRRKQSIATDNYIESVRDAVLHDWLGKSKDERAQLMSMLGHQNSAITFWVVTLKKKRNTLRTDIDQHPIKQDDYSQIELAKFARSFVIFSLEGHQVAKMQVKFNNGILERANNDQASDFRIDGIQMKKGNPIASWNFSTLKSR